MARKNYLSIDHSVSSWLLTTDHKRIGILYLCTILVFFFIASVAAALIRIELLTPQGDLVTSETYNKLFTIHGVLNGLVFPHPIDPRGARQFRFADDDRRARCRISKAQLNELVSFRWWRRISALVDHSRRRRHRLDVLHALQHDLRKLACHLDGSRCLCRGIFFHHYRHEFHGNHAQDARTGPYFGFGYRSSSGHSTPRV